jgi:hypothetical protein
MTHSRRSFLKSSLAVVATAAATPRILSAAAPEADAITPRLNQFGYGDVTLLEGPMRTQFDANHAFYMAMDEDRLLKPFRLRAGLPAPGDDMGGWYDWSNDFNFQTFHGYVPGHTFGQYVSGLARAYAATGDRATQERVQRLVRGYAAAISNNFYVGVRLPCYITDKINIGLIDAHEFAADPIAFKALDATLDTALPHMPSKGLSRDEQYKLPHTDESYCWDEPYTLPENLFLAYKRGAGSRYRDLATRYLADDWYFGPLSEGNNVLPGKHAYSHVNALNSAMQAYLVLGSEKHLRAARNGFDFVRTTQSFATGGWGPDESLREPGKGDLGESLTKTHASFETPCGAYAHFKITRSLLRLTLDSRYGDSMERVLYNTILGARPLQKDGHGFYYSDYNSDGSKVFHPHKWTCCSGTFPQITADYGISAYFHDAGGVYVNLYVPSRVTWKRGGERVSLEQRTSYPYVPATQISVAADKPATFAVNLRIPAWAGPKTTVSVNGKRVLPAPEPGKFAAISRTWKNGDRIEIEFDMQTALEAVDPQHPNLVAAVHGPLALFGVGEIPATITRRQLSAIAQTTAGSKDWQTKTAAGNLTLRSFPAIQDEHYRLYMKVDG